MTRSIDAGEAVLRALIARGIVTPETLVSAGVTVTRLAGSNEVFAARCGARSYIVKSTQRRDRAALLEREVAFYAWAAQRDLPQRAHLARCVVHEHDAPLLIFETQADAQTMRTRRAAGAYLVQNDAAVGRALGALHTTQASDAAFLTRELPWVLEIHRPTLAFYHAASSADLELLRVIQAFPEIGMQLDALREAWEPRALVHNDLRWDNVILSGDEIYIIDWEVAGWGDPAWDAGAYLSEFLSVWVRSIPPGAETIFNMLRLARIPLDALQPAMRTFWDMYRQTEGLLAPPLTTVIRFAGARLIQTAFERTRTRERPASTDFLLLQLSLNLMQQPDALIAMTFRSHRDDSTAVPHP